MKHLILLFLLFVSTLQAVDVYTSTSKGFIYNMPVKNLYYETSGGANCTSSQGYTDENGGFELDKTCNVYDFYLTGEKKIGLISISTIAIQELANDHDGKNIIFMTNLVGASTTNTSNSSAIKLLQLFMSLDDDYNPNNGINLSIDNIISSTTYDDIFSFTQSELQNLVDEQFGNDQRELYTEQCTQSYLEYILRTNPFKTYDISTIGPCDPILPYEQLATSSNETYIEIWGETGSEIVLNGIPTGKFLYLRDETKFPNGYYEEFQIDTSIVYNDFDDYNITLRTDDGSSASSVDIRMFNDTDQPYFGDINSTITTLSNPLIDLNITDSSKDNGLSLTYDINDSRFSIDPDTEIITYNENFTSGTNITFTLNVRDEAWHRAKEEFSFIIP